MNGDGVVNVKDTIVLGKVIAGFLPATEQHDRNNDLVVDPFDMKCFKKMLFKRQDSETINFDTRFVYNTQGQLEGQYDSLGNVVEEYVWFAGQPVVVLRGNQTLYIDSDHLGTPKSVSDQTQTVLWTWDADPYGRAVPTVDVDGNRHLVVLNLRFPGQYFDHESGLHYNINRFYDPSTGRYLESDPIGLEGGINTYGYALGNPVNYTDPDGQIVQALPAGVAACLTNPLCVLTGAALAYCSLNPQICADIAKKAIEGCFSSGNDDKGGSNVIPLPIPTTILPIADNGNNNCVIQQRSLNSSRAVILGLAETDLTQIDAYNRAVIKFNKKVSLHNIKCSKNKVMPLDPILK